MESECFNVYCDESCHLQQGPIPVMVLGATWCPTERYAALSRRVRDIKAKHNLPPDLEVKWTKISQSKIEFYLDLVDYFFDEDDLHFRGILIPNKAVLDHAAHNQTHDTWYYKMCFTMLEPIIDPESRYRIYLDIKDTRSEAKRAKLEQVLRNSRYDFVGLVIERVQQIRSHESDLMQLADLLIGAIGHHNRCQRGDLQDRPTSAAKRRVIRQIRRRSGKSLVNTTWLRERKFNLLCWRPGGRVDE